MKKASLVYKDIILISYHTLLRARDVSTLSIQILEAFTPGPSIQKEIAYKHSITCEITVN